VVTTIWKLWKLSPWWPTKISLRGIYTGDKTLHVAIISDGPDGDLKRLEIFHWNRVARQVDAHVWINLYQGVIALLYCFQVCQFGKILICKFYHYLFVCLIEIILIIRLKSLLKCHLVLCIVRYYYYYYSPLSLMTFGDI
jgi:hypothetical protein